MDAFARVACSPENQEMISYALIQSLGIPPAGLYSRTEHILKLAEAASQARGWKAVLLPFCHTVEAKAMGARITPADETAGPRPGEYAVTLPEQVPSVEIAADPDAARLLEACGRLRQEGRPVIFQLSGPISILSCLMNLSGLFKCWRKDPEAVGECLDRIRHMLRDFGTVLARAGVDCISYADPAGSPDILGPKYGALLTRRFTKPLLEELLEVCGGTTALTVCPLTAAALSREGVLHPARAGEGRLAAGCIKRAGYPVQPRFVLK